MGGNSYGDSWLRLTPSLLPVDYFSPHDQGLLDTDDLDLGSGGVMVVPDQPGSYPHLLAGAGKEGTVYLVNRDSMGMYDPLGDVQIVQALPNAVKGMWGAPVYFNNTLYFSASGDTIKSFQLAGGQLQSPSSQSAISYAYPGAGLSISSGPAGLGILWALDGHLVKGSTGAVLAAYKADNLGAPGLLYSSTTNAPRDNPGTGVKFAVPTVVNGKVYVGGAASLSVFGLLP